MGGTAAEADLGMFNVFVPSAAPHKWAPTCPTGQRQLATFSGTRGPLYGCVQSPTFETSHVQHVSGLYFFLLSSLPELAGPGSDDAISVCRVPQISIHRS